MDIRKLTKEQAIIISGFTGILCGEFYDFHADVEKRLGRGVQTFEFGIKSFITEVKKLYEADFIELATVDKEPAKAQAVPEGFVLVKKTNRIGNPNVDFSQAPRWAKYWLKDGHSNKYWWSSTRPIKDMDLQAFCWRGDYFAEEAPSFNFAGSWDKSLTSKKAMIEAQEPAND